MVHFCFECGNFIHFPMELSFCKYMQSRCSKQGVLSGKCTKLHKKVVKDEPSSTNLNQSTDIAYIIPPKGLQVCSITDLCAFQYCMSRRQMTSCRSIMRKNASLRCSARTPPCCPKSKQPCCDWFCAQASLLDEHVGEHLGEWS